MAEVALTDQNFEKEVLQSRIPVMVELGAEWCYPCKIADPVIKELAKEYDGKLKVGKLDVDKNPKTAQKYGIMSVPTVIFFKDSEEVKREIGFPGKKGYEKLIKEVISG